MKPEIHPEYTTTRITCACGRVTETRATVEELHVEICSHCHPFFTGRQKLVDTAGRVERFLAKYGSAAGDASAEEIAEQAAVRAAESEAQEMPAEETAEEEEEAAEETSPAPTAGSQEDVQEEVEAGS